MKREKTEKGNNKNYKKSNNNNKKYQATKIKNTPKKPNKEASKQTNKHAQKTKLKHFFGIFASWQERYSSKPKGASGFEVNIAPEHMKTPMQKSTMPRLLEKNDYLWGTITRKVFVFLYSPVLSEFCWQLPLSLSP